jgi:hypothetical protein
MQGARETRDPPATTPVAGHVREAPPLQSECRLRPPAVRMPAMVHAWVGMDLDVWKSELSVFVSTKNVNMDICIRICFQYGCHTDVFESYFQYYPNSALSEISDKNPTYPTLFVSAKIK